MKDTLSSKKIPTPKFGFAIGPRIAGKNYEIGEDVAQYFEGKAGLFKEEGRKSHLDLGMNIQEKIREIAIDSVILDFSESTYGSENWYSHRFKDEGRNLNCIRMEVMK
jgi:copper oxidase (laccase) domain-containing protein